MSTTLLHCDVCGVLWSAPGSERLGGAYPHDWEPYDWTCLGCQEEGVCESCNAPKAKTRIIDEGNGHTTRIGVYCWPCWREYQPDLDLPEEEPHD